MNNKHLLPCLIGVVAAGLVMVAFGVNPSTLLLFAVVLACPLMMFFMMKTMMGSNGRMNSGTGDETQTPTDTPATHGRHS